MTTVRSHHLSTLIREGRPSSDPELKKVLAGIALEVKERLVVGSKESHDFFSSVSASIQEIRGTAHSRIRAECLLGCCQYFYLAGTPLHAISPARQLVKLAHVSGDANELRKAENALGILCADTGNFGEAIECSSSVLQRSRSTGDVEAEAGAWINLSTALTYVSRYQEALSCLEKAREIAPKSRTGQMLYRGAAHNMSICYFGLANYEKARLWSEQALQGEAPSSSSDLYAQITREHHYVEALLELGLYEIAKDRLRRASSLATKANTIRAKETVAIIESLVATHCGDVEHAIESLENLAASISKREISPDLQDVLRALARAYEKAGKIEKALRCLHDILSINRKHREESALVHLAVARGATPSEFQSRIDLADLRQRQADLKTKLVERELVQSQMEVLERLAVTADMREEESGEHGYRVGRLAALFAKELGWPREDCLTLEQAARLHDIGKVGIPDRILLSTEVLQESEKRLMSAHAVVGAELLSKSNIVKLRIAEEIARCHHEWWDGTGYPAGIAGNRIPLAARIVALADVFDALTHGRTYEKPWAQEAALAEIERQRGKQFEPKLADQFLAFMRNMLVQQPNLDEFLGREAGKSGVLQARHRIRAMLAGTDVGATRRRFDLASSKS